MAEYVGALDQGTTSTRFMIFDHSGQVVGIDQKEHEQIYPKPGLGRARSGSRSGRAAGGHQGRARQGRHQGHRTWPPSASPTSARRRSSGIGRPARRSTTPSSGRTPGPTRSSTSSPATAARIDSGPRSGCRWRPTSRARRSSGSSTTSMAPGPAPRPAISCSATSTRGASGTSPAASRAASTSPT